MTIYHILNGDCLANQLLQTEYKNNLIVFRECLIEGDTNAESLSEFWEIRTKYMCDSYGISKEDFQNKTISEFEKIFDIPDKSEVYLWFENDLFCQANLWFLIWVLSKNDSLKLYRVFPFVGDERSNWSGFGNYTNEELEKAYLFKKRLNISDINLGINLWNAYQQNNHIKLLQLALTQTSCFTNLQEVCQAHIDRFSTKTQISRPEKRLIELLKNKSLDFESIFREFSNTEGVYGFSDSQVLSMIKKLKSNY